MGNAPKYKHQQIADLLREESALAFLGKPKTDARRVAIKAEILALDIATGRKRAPLAFVCDCGSPDGCTC